MKRKKLGREKERLKSPKSERAIKVFVERLGKQRAIPKEKGKRPGSLRSATVGIAAKTLASAVHPPDRLGVPNPNRGATQEILAMALLDEVEPDKERYNQVLRVPQRPWSLH